MVLVYPGTTAGVPRHHTLVYPTTAGARPARPPGARETPSIAPCGGEELCRQPSDVKKGIEPAKIIDGIVKRHQIPRTFSLPGIVHHIGDAEVDLLQVCSQEARAANGMWSDVERHNLVGQGG